MPLMISVLNIFFALSFVSVSAYLSRPFSVVFLCFFLSFVLAKMCYDVWKNDD